MIAVRQGIAFIGLAIIGALLIGVARNEARTNSVDASAAAATAAELLSNLAACEIPGVRERVIGRGAHSVVYAGEFEPMPGAGVTTASGAIFLYVASGAGTVRIGDRLRNVHAGDFVALPKGVPHAVRGVGGTLRAIYFEDRG